MTEPLLPLADAQEMLIASAKKLPVERIDIAQSLGRIVSENIVSQCNKPAGDMSAMDGYAIKYDHATSWEIIGECRAGYPPCDAVGHGQAARIFTGALLPKGADTVIIQENVQIIKQRLSLVDNRPFSKGQNVRVKGNDFAINDIIVQARTPITAAIIGLLIAAGHKQIHVHKKPNIAIISTGDELRPAGLKCADHQIAASNGPMIAALLSHCNIIYNEIIPDDLDAITNWLNDHKNCDIIVTIGGASVGDHDLVIPALQALRADIDFVKAAIKPGKPILTARLGQTHIIGLPGNPSSAFVTAILFLIPLVKYITGVLHVKPITQTAKSKTALAANGPRAEFLRAHVTGDQISPYPSQDSAKLSTLANANALLIRPCYAPACPAQTWVDYINI